ncbi:MAG: glutathione S-transferase family protein [Caulobacterales bacterium]
MIELHYYPDNASQFPHMLLRELGCPFELRLVDRDHGAQNSAAYLKLNPNGKIPVLVDDGEAIFETAAIGLYLADKFPAAGLAPPPGAPDRGAYYKWMVYLSSTPQAEYRAWFYPHEFVDDPDLAKHAKAAAGERLAGIFERIAAQLGAGPWLLGERFSAADLYLLMLIRWGGRLPRRPRDHPALAAHAQRVLARPAVQATFAAEGVTAPFF